jgi:hypothetical protein
VRGEESAHADAAASNSPVESSWHPASNAEPKTNHFNLGDKSDAKSFPFQRP